MTVLAILLDLNPSDPRVPKRSQRRSQKQSANVSVSHINDGDFAPVAPRLGLCVARGVAPGPGETAVGLAEGPFFGEERFGFGGVVHGGKCFDGD